ncbi:MAG: PD-(D/E)XK nuclease family protein [Treponema sp.]|jgi:hypothetical protein|nr:PD-(D/E)XK nuclease family protein [Treponema sp.]
MEETPENTVSQLLTDVAETINSFEAKWRKTGEKYNLFKVTHIANDEVIMCRVLADLLDPHGKHCQDSRYLGLFWKAISLKLPEQLDLNIKDTKVKTELVIDENRRIDITLYDGRIFVPIEVKIRAGDQPKQVADYYEYAKKRNSVNVNVPVLYLTVDGHEPSDFSKVGIGKKDYVTLSFRDDILAWLEACARGNTPETTVPVRESLRQYIAAIKSLCGKSEDAEMEDAIFKLVTKRDETIRAALEIRKGTNFRERVLKTFTDALVLVKGSFPNAIILPNENSGYDWYIMQIPVRGGNYFLQVNYDWMSIWLYASESYKTDSASQEWANLNRKMKEFFKSEGESVPKERLVWRWEDLSWPSLESYVNNDERDLYLAHLSKLSSQEVDGRIIDIASELENVKA